MNSLYQWAGIITNDKVILINQKAFPDHIKKEIISQIEEFDASTDEDEEDDNLGIDSKINEQEKERVNGPFTKFWLELKKKYTVEEDEFERDKRIFYPLIYINDIKRFINFLKKIQNDEEELGWKISTILSWFEEQIMENNEETTNAIQPEITELRKELRRIWLREDIHRNKYEDIFTTIEAWYLKEKLDLLKAWFCVGHRHSNDLYREMEDLPYCLKGMIDIIIEWKNNRPVGLRVERWTEKTELYEAIKALEDVKYCQILFRKGRTDLLVWLTFILEELAKNPWYPEWFEEEIREIIAQVLAL
jgi:hypothetical protein